MLTNSPHPYFKRIIQQLYNLRIQLICWNCRAKGASPARRGGWRWAIVELNAFL